MSTRIFRLADRVFGQPLLATESLAHSVATYVNSRVMGDDIQAAVNFEKPKGDAKSRLRVHDNVAVVPIMGGLTHRMSYIDAMCTGGLSSYEGLRKGFDEALADDSIDTIVLHVDSGGGEASGCFELARHIKDSRGKKKIITYVDEFACSAAYALASAADEVIASPDADVGSIGVIMIHQEMTKAFQKNGIEINVIKAGHYKGLGSPFQELSDESRVKLQDRINDVYNTFTSFVASARGLSVEDVKGTQADVYSAKDALERGLIDSIKSQDEFLNYLAGSQEESLSSAEITKEVSMTEEEKKELVALREQVAQMKARESEAALKDLTNKLSASADALGFDASHAAKLLMEAGMDSPMSSLFMSTVDGALVKMNEAEEAHKTALAEKDAENAKLKETAGKVVETSVAMEELGNDGEADVEEEKDVQDEPTKASAESEEQRKLALRNALKTMIR